MAQQAGSHGVTRRSALSLLAAGGAGSLVAPTLLAQGAAGEDDHVATMLGWDQDSGQYTLPPLPYAFDALEPHIDAQTMEIHHDRHHAGYVRGLNRALEGLAGLREGTVPASEASHLSHELSFHGGGHVNHTLFWLNMSPDGGGEPGGALGEAIARDFGSFEKFKGQFASASGSVKGSGWGYLCLEPISQKLIVTHMHNQEDGLFAGLRPLLGVDVWEHAYYLKYQNRRGDYIQAFFNVINWEHVGKLYEWSIG